MKTMLLLKFGIKAGGLVTRKAARLKRFSTNIFHLHMDSAVKTLYEEAVYALNGLQSNFVVLQKAREERSANAHLNIINTKKHLHSLGIENDDVESLHVIHVAGTKGKGSTCAFTEAILRKHGLKTGFYSSPHLISVNERIRINGQPISKELFAKYFWTVYNGIQESLKEGESMPPYFLFLTVMAFYVFIKENVQAAVLEVGIGGRYDCTNIVRKPVVVGITTLGIDHTNILGNTISEIADQKAGILKHNTPTFTVPQLDAAMNVLRKTAQDVGCSLYLSPPLEAYDEFISLGAKGVVQNVNACLALQLAHTWLQFQKTKDIPCAKVDESPEDSSFHTLVTAPTFPVTSEMQDALKTCVWPGRFQVVHKGKITFYLDGAHTQQSMRHCARWFEEESQDIQSQHQSQVLRVLLFNCTGDRKAESLLHPLSDLPFDLAIFCPNRINVMKDATSDLSNFMIDPQKEIQQCTVNKEIWDHLQRSMYENTLSSNSTYQVASVTNLKSSTPYNSIQLSSISNVLKFISFYEDLENELDYSAFDSCFIDLIKSANSIQVLVTGSLHLVGGVLSLIES